MVYEPVHRVVGCGLLPVYIDGYTSFYIDIYTRALYRQLKGEMHDAVSSYLLRGAHGGCSGNNLRLGT